MKNSKTEKNSWWKNLFTLDRIVVLILFFGMIFQSFAQIAIPNSTPIVENFNGIGTSATASLPANWKMSAAGVSANWATGTNVTATSQAACGTATTAGGRYNWGVSAACTDRAIGFMTSGSYASANTILAHYSNTSGSTITDISFSFDVERYRINTANVSLAFFTSTDGTTWTPQASGDVAAGVFANAASSYTFATPQTINKSVTLTGINLASGASFYTRWIITNTGSSNSQGIGIDNVSLTATVTACVPPAEPTIQASNLTINNITETSLQLNWTRGNGTHCMVVGRANTGITAYPIDGNPYTPSSVFGNGSTTGASQFVVYSNTGNSVVVTALAPNTSYFFEIYEFNSSGACTNYLSSTLTSSNAVTLPTASYNFYRGTIHAHTAYSDGDLDGVCPTFGSAATCCYNIANTADYFDYMGLADHNHNEGTAMNVAKYHSGLQEAANCNLANPGTFVGLYGMEWGTISTGGHACIYGIESLVGWNPGNFDVFIAKGDYDGLFNLVSSTPNAFAYLAHPAVTDFNNLFTSAYNASYDDAIIGLSLENGPYNSVNTTYTDPPTGAPDEVRYKDLLKLGYHVAPGIDLDSHNSNVMGKSSQGRTVVLASELTKTNVVEAYRLMHFYATEDYNTDVFYTINSTIIMGTITAGASNPVIDVAITDPDLAESVSSIEIYFGVPGSGIAPTILTSNTLSSTLNYTHVVASGTYYYYAKIVQADGDRIWTAPIWYTSGVNLPIDLLCFDATLGNDNFVKLNWSTTSEKNNDYFTIEKTNDGTNFIELTRVDGSSNSNTVKSYETFDYNPLMGQSYYRLKQTDFDGKYQYSQLVPIQLEAQIDNSIIAFPNPTNGLINISLNSEQKSKMNLKIYNLCGEILLNYEIEKKQGNETFLVQLSNFVNGIYLLEISSGDQIFTKKIIKQ